MRSFNTIVLVCFILVLNGCQQKNRFYIADLDNSVPVNIHRFDLDFMDMDTMDIPGNMALLRKKYPEFFSFYLNQALMMHPEDSIENAAMIRDYLTDSLFVSVHTKVKTVYHDIHDLEKQLGIAYAYLKHYFPTKSLPEIYFFVSGFNHTLLINDAFIGIGSDMYLGSDYPVYQDVTHDYLIRNMHKGSILPDITNQLLHTLFPIGNDLNVLASMLYEGKLRYLLEIILPDYHPATILGYTEKEMNWCKENEKHIWGTIMEHRHLFSTDYKLIIQYVNVAPFTAPISRESPGQLGIWMGWQIIESYMQNNREVNLMELMQNTNYQELLEQSRYRP